MVRSHGKQHDFASATAALAIELAIVGNCCDTVSGDVVASDRFCEFATRDRALASFCDARFVVWRRIR